MELGNYEYKTGLIIGRFQPLHKGHEMLIRTALNHCEFVIVVVGSCNKSGTIENPINGGTRMWTIRSCFMPEYREGRLIVVGVPDRVHIQNDSSWGEYVMERIAEVTPLVPTIVFEGYEPARTFWYKTLDIDVYRVNREELKISGTELRYAILRGDKDYYLANCATNMESYYDEIKEALENATKNA